MSSEKKFRIQNGLDVAGEVLVNGINIVGADGVLNQASYQTAVQAMIDATVAQGVDQNSIDSAVSTAVAALADSAPETLNTLNELAAALGDDADFATSMTNALNTKLNAANNLSDVADAAAARSNLGLGTAATAATTSFATAAQGVKADSAAQQTDLDNLAAQIAADASGGSSKNFIASGSITSGESVLLNSSGTVSSCGLSATGVVGEEVTSELMPPFGNNANQASYIDMNTQYASYDFIKDIVATCPITNRTVFFVSQNYSNGSQYRVQSGFVNADGNGFDFGTPVTIQNSPNGSGAANTSICFSGEGDGMFLIVYSSATAYNDVSGAGLKATLCHVDENGVITVHNSYQVVSGRPHSDYGTWNWAAHMSFMTWTNSVVWDPSQSKFVIAFGADSNNSYSNSYNQPTKIGIWAGGYYGTTLSEDAVNYSASGIGSFGGSNVSFTLLYDTNRTKPVLIGTGELRSGASGSYPRSSFIADVDSNTIQTPSLIENTSTYTSGMASLVGGYKAVYNSTNGTIESLAGQNYSAASRAAATLMGFYSISWDGTTVSNTFRPLDIITGLESDIVEIRWKDMYYEESTNSVVLAYDARNNSSATDAFRNYHRSVYVASVNSSDYSLVSNFESFDGATWPQEMQGGSPKYRPEHKATSLSWVPSANKFILLRFTYLQIEGQYNLPNSTQYQIGINLTQHVPISTAASAIGFAQDTVTSGGEVTVMLGGGVSETHTGLTVGSEYFIQDDGTISTTTSPILAGLALSATELQVADLSDLDNVNLSPYATTSTLTSTYATKSYADMVASQAATGVDFTTEIANARSGAVADVAASDLDMGGNKVLFGNLYSTLADLPDASTYHGMFAHVHATGKGYFAHAGNWVELANSSDLLTQSDIDTAVANLVDTAPEALNTLNELAAALGDDANFASTVTTSLAAKADASAVATTAQGALADTAVQPSQLSTGISTVSTNIADWTSVTSNTEILSPNYITNTGGNGGAAYFMTGNSTHFAHYWQGYNGPQVKSVRVYERSNPSVYQFEVSVSDDATFAFSDDYIAILEHGNSGGVKIYQLSDGSQYSSFTPNNQHSFSADIAFWGNDKVIVGAGNDSPDYIHLYGISGNLLGSINANWIGNTLAVSGDKLFASDKWYNGNYGRVYVVDLPTFAITSYIQSPTYSEQEYFGQTVDSNDEYLLVSRRAYTGQNGNGEEIYPGAVDIFNVSDGSFVATFEQPNPSINWSLGHTHDSREQGNMSISGNFAAIPSKPRSNNDCKIQIIDIRDGTSVSELSINSLFGAPGGDNDVFLDGENLYILNSGSKALQQVVASSSSVDSYVVNDSVFATKAYVDSGVAGVDLSGYTTTADLTSNDLDLNGNKVLFGNVYSTLADLPDASTYHGMFAHVHATGKGYFAHAGNWVELANSSDLLTQSDIDTAVNTAVANVIDTAPDSLNTLNELAAALGDDANFASTVTTSLAAKADSTALDAAVADIATNTTALATKATTAQGALADTAVQPSDLGQLASFSASTGLSAVTNTLVDWPTSDIAFDSGSTIFTQSGSSISGGSFDIVSNSNYIVLCSSGANPDLTIIDSTTDSTVATIDLGSYSSGGGYAVPNGLQIDETKVYVTTMATGGNARTWAWNLSDQTLAWDLGSPSGKNLRMAGISADKSELIMVQSDVGASNEWRTDKALCISTYDGSTTVPEFEIPATTYHPTQDYYVESAVKTDSLILIGTPSSELINNNYNDGIVFVFDSNGTHLQTVENPNMSHLNHPGDEGASQDGFGKDMAVWNNKVVILSKGDQSYNSGTSTPNYGDDSIITIWTTSASGITLESTVGLDTGTNTGGQIDGNLTIVGNTAYISGYQTNHSTYHWRGGTFIVDLASASLKTKLLGPDYGPANNLDPDGAAAFFGFPTSDRNHLEFSTKSTGSLGDLYVISVLDISGQDNTLFLTKYSANVTVNKNLSVDDSVFATKAYVDSGVAGVDLSGYTTTADLTSSDLDLNGNKVLFGNVYSTVADLPDASTYHGMFAHVHATGKGYFAHAGNWVELANSSDLLTQSDIDTAVSNLVDSAPEALNTLNELAAALGDDANFASTVTTSLAAKADSTALDAAVADIATNTTALDAAVADIATNTTALATKADSSAVATTAQGALADTALQPEDLGTGFASSTSTNLDLSSSFGTLTATHNYNDIDNNGGPMPMVTAAYHGAWSGWKNTYGGSYDIAVVGNDIFGNGEAGTFGSTQSTIKLLNMRFHTELSDTIVVGITMSGPAGSGFGQSVAFNDNYMVVGAPRQSDGGAIHIFTPDANNYVGPVDHVVTGNTALGLTNAERFGSFVVMVPGADEVIVSAPRTRELANQNYWGGRVVHINLSDRSIIKEFIVPNPRYGMQLGDGSYGGMAVKGDYLFVCEPGIPGGDNKVHQFSISTGNHIRALVAADGGGMSRFGSAMAVVGDYLVVGEQNANEDLYVFDMDGNLTSSIIVDSASHTGWVGARTLNDTTVAIREYTNGIFAPGPLHVFNVNSSGIISLSFVHEEVSDIGLIEGKIITLDSGGSNNANSGDIKIYEPSSVETTTFAVSDSVFATKTYVDTGIAAGVGAVDLSGYTTTADLTSSDLDLNGNKVLFGNVYSNLADLPSATTYHGMFAHVHATGKGYFAHAGNWVELANSSDLVTQSDIDTAVTTAVAGVVDAAPDSLNTLNELAAALGDDENFASTVTTSLASKADSATVTAALADKADVTYVNSEIAGLSTTIANINVTGDITSALDSYSTTAQMNTAISTSLSDYSTTTQMNTAISTAVDGVLDSAPGTLDTLNELAAALGDDPNFATSITTSLASKADASAVATTAQGALADTAIQPEDLTTGFGTNVVTSPDFGGSYTTNVVIPNWDDAGNSGFSGYGFQTIRSNSTYYLVMGSYTSYNPYTNNRKLKLFLHSDNSLVWSKDIADTRQIAMNETHAAIAENDGVKIYDMAGNLVNTFTTAGGYPIATNQGMEFFGDNGLLLGDGYPNSNWQTTGRVFAVNYLTGQDLGTINLPVTQYSPNNGISETTMFAVSPDQSKVYIGDWRGSPVSERYGRVYVADLSTFTVTDTIENPNGADEEDFGISVAVNNDYLVVARNNKGGSNNASRGALEVFNVSDLSHVGTLTHNPTSTQQVQYGVSQAFPHKLAVAQGSNYVFASIYQGGSNQDDIKVTNLDDLSQSFFLETNQNQTMAGPSVVIRGSDVIAFGNGKVARFTANEGTTTTSFVVDDSVFATKAYVDSGVAGIDLSGYSTTVQMNTAITTAADAAEADAIATASSDATTKADAAQATAIATASSDATTKANAAEAAAIASASVTSTTKADAAQAAAIAAAATDATTKADAAQAAAIAAAATDATTKANAAQTAAETFATNAATTAVANVIDTAPDSLNTLNELAAALGDDANFASTVTAALADKADSTTVSSVSTVANSALQPADAAGLSVDDADKLDGEHGTHYRINIYDINGTLVN